MTDKGIQKLIARKQGVGAIGNQQRRFNLQRVGVQLAALMAEERIDRRNAHLQQGKKGDVKLGDVAQLHQRGFATLHTLRLQGCGHIVDRLVELTPVQMALAVDYRPRVAVGVAGQNVGQGQILPVAFFTVASG
ncbi:hypothetical protein D3C75_527060 [compost metagenome]